MKIFETKSALKVSFVFSLAGFLLSCYLAYSHVQYKRSPEYESGCAWLSGGENDPCKNVNASPYAEFFGIPTAACGAGMFLALLGLSVAALKKDTFQRKALVGTCILSGLGILVYLYLTYLELFVIHAVCPLCVTTSVFTLIIFLSALFPLKKSLN